MSSYRASAGQVKKPEWLEADWLLPMFGRRGKSAIEVYKKFVSEGKGHQSPWGDLRNQVFLGDSEFVTQLQGLIDSDKELSEVPVSQRQPKALELVDYETKAQNRDEAIYFSYMSGGYTLKEIGKYFSSHYSHVSRIVKKEKRKTYDPFCYALPYF